LRAARFPKKHWSYPLIALLAGVIAIARVVATTHVFNHTIDEPYHIGSAVVLWEARTLTVGAQHPPLARWVIGLPLIAQGLRLPEARGEYVVVEYPGYSIGNDLLFSHKLPYWRILTAARHSLLIFAALALFYVYRLGRYLGGSAAGMLAMVFFSVDPTFLAHAGMVGTDIAGCAGFVAGFYYLLRFCARRRSMRRAIVAGVATGLALACKLSSLLLIPVFILILLLRRIFWRKRLPPWRRLLVACAIAFVVLWSTYGFVINPLRQQAVFSQEPIWKNLPTVVQEQPIPMPAFFLGQMLLSHRAAQGHDTYLDGQLSFDGWAMYFPVALAVKQPVGFLLALLVALVIFIIRFRSQRSILLLVPIVMLFGLGMRSHYQLGIRHLLPILPLMYIFTVMQFARARRLVLIVPLIVLAGVETASIHPDYLAFFNFAVGGPRQGERYLLDSNLDWGQDIYRLSQWLRSDEAKGRRYTIRASYTNERMLREFGLDPAALKAPPHGLFAISKNVRHGLGMADRDSAGQFPPAEDFSWLSRYPVVKRIGYSIDVYDLDAKDSQPK
jgi:hypothetical protein